MKQTATGRENMMRYMMKCMAVKQSGVTAWLHIISVREKLAVIAGEPNDFPLDGFALFRPAQTRGPRNYIL